MKKLVFTVLLFLAVGQTMAQDQYDLLKAQYDSLLAAGNESEALPITKAMNQWALEHEGDTSLRFAVSFRYIGNCFENNDSALKYYELSKYWLERQYRSTDLEYGNCINNIGLRYFDLKQFEKAKEMIENALAIFRITPGISSPRYRSTLLALGNLYNQWERSPEAIAVYSQFLSLMDSLNIKDNDNLLFLNSRLAYLFKKISNFEQAEIAYKRKVELTRISDDKSQTDLADAIDQHGDVLLQLKKHDEAEAKYYEALNIRIKSLGENHPDVAYSYCNFANLFSELNEFDKSIQFHIKSISILKFDTTVYNSDLPAALNNLANEYITIQQYNEAIKCLREAIHIYEHAPDSQDILDLATAYNGIGIVYFSIDDYSNSDYFLKKALEIREHYLGKNNADYAATVANLGVLNHYKGNYLQSLQYYNKSAEIQEKVFGVNHPDYLSTVINIGSAYMSLDLIDSAEKYMLLSLEKTDILYGKQHYKYAECLHNLSILYKSVENYKLSENYSLLALEINKRIFGSNSLAVASSLQTLGNVNEKLGDLATAKKYLHKALLIKIDLLGMQNTECADLMNDLAQTLIANEEYKSAEEYLQMALKINRRIRGLAHPAYANNLNSLGVLNSIIGKFKIAEYYYKKSINVITKHLGDESQSCLYPMRGLCLLYIEHGRYQSAEDYLNQIIKINKLIYGEESFSYANCIQNCAVSYYRMKNIDKAETHFKDALSIRSKLFAVQLYDDIIALGCLGDIFRKKKDYTSSLNYYTKSIEIVRKDMYSNFIWRSSKQKDVFLKKRKDEFNFSFIYDFSLDTYQYLPNSADLSYNTSLITRTVMIDDSYGLQRFIRSSNDSMSIYLFHELRSLRRTLAKIETEGSPDKSVFENFRSQADSLDKILVNRVGEYAALQRRFDISWTDVQNSLKPDEAAIEFTRYYDYNDTIYKYMAQVVLPGYEYPHIVKLCREQELAAFSGGQGLAELYKLVWQPLDSLLQGVKTLYYSPDGQLHSIPFHALCINDSLGCTYLMDQYSLHQLSTTRYLADSSLIKTKTLNPSIALYGGIRYDITPDSIPEKQVESNEDFLLANTLKREMTRGAAAYLPGSKAEVETIAPMLNKQQWTTSISTGKQASENSFKALSDTASPSIIHIATHGFAFPEKEEKKKSRVEMMSLGNEHNRYSAADDPMLRCGLMFAGANRSWTGQQQDMIAQTGEDGILTAAEVANMDLSNTKLVVLSACETGLGKIEGSEGVFGLQRGFKLAGVEQLIVSLWQVPDKETNTLMTLFYADLAITKDPVKSFATAQREMRERYPDNPELWAGFVLVR